MKLVINGEQTEHRDGCSLDEVLEVLSIATDRVAVLVNDEVVRRDNRAARVLNEGDRVELLTFAPGG